ncbi:MAG: hypothetical protein CM1200mP4_5190 [Rhodospirillaceae bacterium]|nr:MAG: hypothetical protein CM1200mP4_5190 [Rhodospirillaceae bacterium]
MCMQTFGGFGFAEEYDIERKFRESRLYQIAPISTNMILGYIGQHVLGLPGRIKKVGVKSAYTGKFIGSFFGAGGCCSPLFVKVS